jgi:F0F1-type ATP synthase gamma subunit
LDIDERYAGQFLSIEAVYGNGRLRNTQNDRNLAVFESMSSQVSSFSDKYQQMIAKWGELLDEIKNSEKRAVVWGAGSKGISFLNTLGITNTIKHAIDINPRKQGMYTAGTGQKIVSPNFLREYHPEVIIVMNAIYLNEIKQFINEYDIAPEFLIA